MGPVHETTEIVVLIQAAEAYPVAQAQRHALRHFDVMGNQQRSPVSEFDDETLVSGSVSVVGQQARDESRVFDPAWQDQPAAIGTMVISTRRFA